MKRTIGILCAALLLAAGSGGAALESNQDCLSCHGLKALDEPSGHDIYVDGSIFSRSIHGGLKCRECHTGVKDYPHGTQQAVKCESCHETARRYDGAFHASGLTNSVLFRTRDGVYVTVRSAPVPPTPDAACLKCHEGVTTARSAHEGRRCVECHTDARPNHGKLSPPDCGRCHIDEKGNYGVAAHGEHFAAGDTMAPSCATCHGGHDILRVSDPASSVHPTKVSRTCLKCHGDSAFQKIHSTGLKLTAEAYEASVHGRPSKERGLSIAATCVDCHGAHTILPRSNPRSAVAFANLASTCGRCHAEEAADFVASSHGRAVSRGAHEAPICSDCHGEHEILSHTDPQSPTYRMQVAQNLCLGCHDRPAIQQKFGLSAGRGSTYEKSYHGLATRGKSSIAAVCTDCHEKHRIMGEDDPTSTINPANRLKMCQRCHVGAAERFASFGKIHFEYEDHWMTMLVKWFYIMMITGTLGGMLVWVSILMIPSFRHRISAAGAAAPRRFSKSEIVQHLMLVLSFITLAVTGLALAFPDAFWVLALQESGLLTESTRSLVHRIAGVILMLAGAWHLGFLALTPRGRGFLLRMIPKLHDAKTALQHARHSFDPKTPHPHFKHFSYFEKAEYWALVWGTIVMAATGMILWFPTQLPRLVVSVSEAVHYFEAILAVGAIMIWHFFFIFVDPNVYPFNPSILTGRAPKGTELADRTEDWAGKK